MPQFDFTTYSAQIFWFAICFAALYFFMSEIILPRIRSIVSERKSVVDNNNSEANSLILKTDSIRENVDAILLQADLKYKFAIEEALKNAALKKEKAIADLKIDIERKIVKSRDEIEKMIKSSEAEISSAVKQLTNLTKNKIFN